MITLSKYIKAKEQCTRIFWISVLTILVFVFISTICFLIGKNENKVTSPVEEIILIDSINKVNTKLVIEVELLDSIKYVEKDKVIHLNNDSTLKLFYELIRK